ncbi:sce7726 family protein [Spongiimicrobium sp. 2-473A-2-J]|uniref:sce7726 family protein n=1 Tax=Eudoraea algarum TaxID=3417568 RepID=UPI003D36588E
MPNQQSHQSLLKYTSLVFSNSSFDRILKKGEHDFIKRKAKKYSSFNPKIELSTYNDFFEHLYNSMLLSYRNEYIYKNTIVNKILLGRHNLNTAIAFNEFRIGKSIADLVLLNGTSVVYEIKTEYDSTDRLLSQINEYRKSFLNVVVVTHYSIAQKYISFFAKNNLSNIGLIYFSRRNTLVERIKPKTDSSHLDISYMFKCLRKGEYSKIIQNYFGYLPEVPNTQFFRECLNLALEIDPLVFHDLMFSCLKQRSLKGKEEIASETLPRYLKHIGISSNFSNNDIYELKKFINQKI